MDLCELLQPFCFHDDIIHIPVNFMIRLAVALYKLGKFCGRAVRCTEALRSSVNTSTVKQFEDAH